MATVKIEGLQDLQKALAELPKATSRNVQKRAMIKALTPMETQAEALAPVETGNLRAGFSIGTKLSGRQAAEHRATEGSKTVLTADGYRSTPQTVQFVFMGPRPGAKTIVQEFGSRYQSPHPYMRPAWDSNKVAALNTIADELWSEIDKAAQRAARKAARDALKMKA
jgi:HK97 gp10 family phage protein